MDDPTVTDPTLYRLLWENDRVRVLEYRDVPGDQTHLHHHPDSVMVTLSAFDRALTVGDRNAQVHLEPGEVRWLDEQSHVGHNVGQSETHVVFIELKEPRPTPAGEATLGPSGA